MNRSPASADPSIDSNQHVEEAQQWQYEQMDLDPVAHDTAGYSDGMEQALDAMPPHLPLLEAEAANKAGQHVSLFDDEIELQFDKPADRSAQNPGASSAAARIGINSGDDAAQNDIKEALKKLSGTIKQRATQQAQAVSASGQQRVLNNPTVEMALEKEAVQRAAANIRINPQLLHAQQDDLANVFNKAAAKHIGATAGVSAPLRTTAPADKQKKWSYQMLLETDALMKYTRQVINDFRGYFKHFHDHSLQRQELEWVIMVDNSGSMHSKKTQTAEALVLAIESLRRLECRFSVWRFGNKGPFGRVALKTFEEPFTYAIGQRILEGFTYNEGTYPGTNLKAIAQVGSANAA